MSDFLALKYKARLLGDLDLQINQLEDYPYLVVDRDSRQRILNFLEWLRPLQYSSCAESLKWIPEGISVTFIIEEILEPLMDYADLSAVNESTIDEEYAEILYEVLLVAREAIDRVFINGLYTDDSLAPEKESPMPTQFYVGREKRMPR